jgi:flagellar biosynthetic protein FlhB
MLIERKIKMNRKNNPYYLRYNLQYFAKEGPGGEKTEPATSKKMGDARGKGQVAKSTDLITAAMLLTCFLLLKYCVGYIGDGFLASFHSLYALIEKAAKGNNFNSNFNEALMALCIKDILLISFPIFIAAFVVAFAINIFQVKWKITLEPLKPTFSKFNPVSGFSRLFSKDKVVDLIKSILKIIVIGYIAYDTLKDKWNMLTELYHMSLFQAIAWIGDMIIKIGLKISIFFIIIAAADYKYQKFKFNKDMKMTKQEVKDEYKQSEGDPKVKSQIRGRMREASMRRMMQSLPKADVVITNPTHLAVAIQYDRESSSAPLVTAKGADHLAEKIKIVARENNIEIVENKPLARMLYYNVELGQEIPQELYQMVAEILAYVYGLKGKI